MEAKVPETKICPDCGASFTCTHDASCWCMSYRISEENLKIIAEKYSNCLCPDCLARYARPKDI